MGSKMPQGFQSCTDFMVESCLCRLCQLTNFAMLQNSSERRASCLPDVTRIQRHGDTSCGQRVALVQNESAHLQVGTKERGKCWKSAFSRFSTSLIPHILSEGLPRERSSKMANNMYLDPAFSSFAASKDQRPEQGKWMQSEIYEKHEFKFKDKT